MLQHGQPAKISAPPSGTIIRSPKGTTTNAYLNAQYKCNLVGEFQDLRRTMPDADDFVAVSSDGRWGYTGTSWISRA
jgi:predicted ATPase